jgi:hypothetical protein
MPVNSLAFHVPFVVDGGAGYAEYSDFVAILTQQYSRCDSDRIVMRYRVWNSRHIWGIRTITSSTNR